MTEGPEGSGIVDIRDARTGESVRSFRGHDGDIIDVAFNHDGTLLATTGDDGAARIWNPATGEELHAVEQPDNHERLGAWGPSFSPDGSLFAAAWPGDGVVRVLDLATGRVVQEIRSVPAPWVTSFDPTGDPASPSRRFGAGWPWSSTSSRATRCSPCKGTAASSRTSPGARTARRSPPRAPTAVPASSTPAPAASASRSSAVEATCDGLDWSPDATRLVTGHSDGTATVWLVTEGEPARAAVSCPRRTPETASAGWRSPPTAPAS